MRALIKTKDCTFVEKITSAYDGTFNGIEGLFLEPVTGDTFFIEMDNDTANSYIHDLFMLGKIKLINYEARLVDDYDDDKSAVPELYDPRYEYCP